MSQARIKHYVPGEFIILRRSPSDGIYLITSGQAEFEQARFLSGLGGTSAPNNEVMGLEELLTGSRLDHSIRCVSFCEVLFVPRAEVFRVLRNKPGTLYAFRVRLMRKKWITVLTACIQSLRYRFFAESFGRAAAKSQHARYYKHAATENAELGSVAKSVLMQMRRTSKRARIAGLFDHKDTSVGLPDAARDSIGAGLVGDIEDKLKSIHLLEIYLGATSRECGSMITTGKSLSASTIPDT